MTTAEINQKLQEFIAQWNGRPLEVSDPSNAFQCMDLAFAWCDKLSIPRVTIAHLHASQVWTAPNDETIKYFEMVPNTKLGVPIAGDLVVWSGGASGHIAVATGKNSDTTKVETFDQNWNGHKYCEIVNHNNYYVGVYGWLRPRVTVPPVTSDWEKKYNELANQMRRIKDIANNSGV